MKYSNYEEKPDLYQILNAVLVAIRLRLLSLFHCKAPHPTTLEVWRVHHLWWAYHLETIWYKRQQVRRILEGKRIQPVYPWDDKDCRQNTYCWYFFAKFGKRFSSRCLLPRYFNARHTKTKYIGFRVNHPIRDQLRSAMRGKYVIKHIITAE